jgi:hypothetical protein
VPSAVFGPFPNILRCAAAGRVRAPTARRLLPPSPPQCTPLSSFRILNRIRAWFQLRACRSDSAVGPDSASGPAWRGWGLCPWPVPAWLGTTIAEYMEWLGAFVLSLALLFGHTAGPNRALRTVDAGHALHSSIAANGLGRTRAGEHRLWWRSCGKRQWKALCEPQGFRGSRPDGIGAWRYHDPREPWTQLPHGNMSVVLQAGRAVGIV